MRLDIPALVVPGHDAAHATSAARYLKNASASGLLGCAGQRQTEENVPKRIMEFLSKQI